MHDHATDQLDFDSTPADEGPPKLIYTVTEVAQLLGISRAFAYELVGCGEIPALRLGRRIVVPRAPLDALVSEAGAVSNPRRV